jgi:hypothetical protein
MIYQASITSASLSENARQLYQTITDYMKHKNVKDVWIDDNKASRSTRLTLPKLAFAQSELNRSGLLVLVPGLAQTRYIVPEGSEVSQ